MTTEASAGSGFLPQCRAIMTVHKSLTNVCFGAMYITLTGLEAALGGFQRVRVSGRAVGVVLAVSADLTGIIINISITGHYSGSG